MLHGALEPSVMLFFVTDVPRKLVVAGLVTALDGRVLITQRPSRGALADKWEFPGGKIEPGEAPEKGIHRELLEEIDCSVDVGPVWDVLHHLYEEFELIMLVYHCRIPRDQVPQCREVKDLAWVRPAEICDYDFLAADQPLVDRLVAEGPPRWPDSPP